MLNKAIPLCRLILLALAVKGLKWGTGVLPRFNTQRNSAARPTRWSSNAKPGNATGRSIWPVPESFIRSRYGRPLVGAQVADSAVLRPNNFYSRGHYLSYGSPSPSRATSAIRGAKRQFCSPPLAIAHNGRSQSWLRACRHLTVFHVADVTVRPSETVCRLPGRHIGLARQYDEVSAKQALVSLSTGLVRRQTAYAAFFGLRARLALPGACAMEGMQGNREEGTPAKATGRRKAPTVSARALAEVSDGNRLLPNGYGEH